MFLVKSNPNKEMKIVLRRLKQKLGHVPPNFELFATIHPHRFMMFLEEINYLANHPTIQPDFFTLLRFYISSQYGFTYCYKFNQSWLLDKGYRLDDLTELEASYDALPLDKNHQSLFSSVIQAIEHPETFTSESIEVLKGIGWSDADIYDAIDHGAFLFRFSKILRAYSKG